MKNGALFLAIGFLYGVVISKLWHEFTADHEGADWRQVLRLNEADVKVQFAAPPLYLLKETGRSDVEAGWLYLTPFAEEIVALSFRKEERGQTSFDIHVGSDLFYSYGTSSEGAELFLRIGPYSFRDVDVDGQWDIRYKNDGGDILSWIRLNGDWMASISLPRQVKERLNATLADGQVYFYSRDAREWLPVAEEGMIRGGA